MQVSTSLPPQTSLTQALALENVQIRQYREWALRFRPFDSGIALILEMQAKEMEDHRELLLRHANRWGSPDGHPHIAERPEDPVGADHFFILAADTAVAVLKSAWALTEEARCAYRRWMRNAPEDSPLGVVFQSLCALKDVHIQILLEAQARLESTGELAPVPCASKIA